MIGTRKPAYRQIADPIFETCGRKTDLEYDALVAERGGLPDSVLWEAACEFTGSVRP